MSDRDADELSDEQLLAAFAGGDRSALGELARRHEIALLGLCCGLLGGKQDLAMDAVQDMWLRVIRFARNFNGQSSVKTWLYRIAINQSRTLQAKVAREAKRRTDTAERNDGRDATSLDCDPIRERRVVDVDDERSQRVREAIAKLDINRRTLVLLCYHACVTHAQAAEILGIPIGTLKSRLNATLTHLRQMLPEEVKT